MDLRVAIQVIDNFLDKEEFKKIQSYMISNYFPWFYCDHVSYENDKDKFYFTHNFYKDSKPQSSYFSMLDNLLKKLEIKSLIRVKGNLHIRSNKIKYNNFHTDYLFKVKPKENRVVLFDPSIEHKSSRCSDSKTRVNININYF
jgi:hypothetical protein